MPRALAIMTALQAQTAWAPLRARAVCVWQGQQPTSYKAKAGGMLALLGVFDAVRPRGEACPGASQQDAPVAGASRPWAGKDTFPRLVLSEIGLGLGPYCALGMQGAS